MNETLLTKIRIGRLTNTWSNKKSGKFEYIQSRLCYRFIETTPYPYSWIVPERERNDENTPIVIKGLLAFLVACWGQKELAIYNTYNQRIKEQFLDVESKKPGSFKRDLERDFARDMLNREQKHIKNFSDDFDYISIEEKNLLLEYGKNYLEYTATTYQQELKPAKIEQTLEALLHHDRKIALMKTLHELLDNKTGKDVAIVLKSLYKLGYLAPPSNRNELYRIMKKTFGYIGTTQNLNSFLNPDSTKILDAELESTIQILQRV